MQFDTASQNKKSVIDEKQYNSIYADCEELVKILVTRCKKINAELEDSSSYILHLTSYISKNRWSLIRC